MRCSELRALPLRRGPAPRHQPAQVEVWGELGEGEVEEEAVQFVNLCQAEAVEEAAREPLPRRRKTVPALRVKVRMVCRNMSRTS